MGSLKRKNSTFFTSPSRRRYKATLLLDGEVRGVSGEVGRSVIRLTPPNCTQICPSTRHGYQKLNASPHPKIKHGPILENAPLLQTIDAQKTTPFPATTAHVDAAPHHSGSPRRCGRRRTRASAPPPGRGRRRRRGCSPQWARCVSTRASGARAHTLQQSC